MNVMIVQSLPAPIVAVLKARETHQVRRYGMFLAVERAPISESCDGYGSSQRLISSKMAADLLFLLR
jgi:hypothetical protein